MAALKLTAVRVALFGAGFVISGVLFLLASLVLAGLGYGGGYALYNGYFLVIVLWLIAALATYFLTKGRESGVRFNSAIFLAGVVALSAMGGLHVLLTTPQYLIFWPH